MYKLKEYPEDFVVKEELHLETADKGKYAYYTLEKRGLTTTEALKIVSRERNTPMKLFGYAGMKDKIAVTTQHVSVKGKAPKDLFAENVIFRRIGFGDRPISLGDLKANTFEIVVRKVKEMPPITSRFVNYFDEQRFSEKNIAVGRSIVKGGFEEATRLLDLKAENNNFVGALRTLSKKMLLLYVHAYQSYLWNRAVSSLIRVRYNVKKEIRSSAGVLAFADDVENQSIPILGFDTSFEDKDLQRVYHALLLEEQVTPRSFIVRQIPEISSEGGARDLVVEAIGLDIKDMEDNKIKLTFTLPKGSYATMFIRSLFDGS